MAREGVMGMRPKKSDASILRSGLTQHDKRFVALFGLCLTC